ncbi:hypothetical protein TNCV_4655971 [Trichonephila clavipes]|nr:hypothetical protein TNCV_4655971 [Trichonephila clavipes]
MSQTRKWTNECGGLQPLGSVEETWACCRPDAWPPHSSDLNPLEFFWGYLKSLLYERPVTRVENIMVQIIVTSVDIASTPDLSECVRRSGLCYHLRGRNFEQSCDKHLSLHFWLQAVMHFSYSEKRPCSTGSPLDPQKNKGHHNHILWQVYCNDPKNQEPWKAKGNLGHCGPYPEAPEESQDHSLATGHDFLRVYLHWLGLATDEACPLSHYARMDGDHLLQYT